MFCSLKTETYTADRKLVSKHSYNNKSLCEMSGDLMSLLISSQFPFVQRQNTTEKTKKCAFSLGLLHGKIAGVITHPSYTQRHTETLVQALSPPPQLCFHRTLTFTTSFTCHFYWLPEDFQSGKNKPYSGNSATTVTVVEQQ